MAELFGVDVRTINYHIKQIEESGEIHLSNAIRKIWSHSEKWTNYISHKNIVYSPANI